MTRTKRREPLRKPANWGQGKRTAARAAQAPRQIPPDSAWTDEEPTDERVVTAALAAGIDPEDLAYHVEVGHGWETHDEGYERAVEQSVACALRSAAAGEGADTCLSEGLNL